MPGKRIGDDVFTFKWWPPFRTNQLNSGPIAHAAILAYTIGALCTSQTPTSLRSTKTRKLFEIGTRGSLWNSLPVDDIAATSMADAAAVVADDVDGSIRCLWLPAGDIPPPLGALDDTCQGSTRSRVVDGQLNKRPQRSKQRRLRAMNREGNCRSAKNTQPTARQGNPPWAANMSGRRRNGTLRVQHRVDGDGGDSGFKTKSDCGNDREYTT